MENIGALSILLAFCFAVYAVVASVIGRLKKNSFLIVSGATRGLLGLAAADRRGRAAHLFPAHGRFPAGLRGGAHRFVHVDDLQVHGVVGRTGRLAAVVVVAAGHLFGRRGLHEPAQVPRHDAVGDVGADDHRNVLPDA